MPPRSVLLDSGVWFALYDTRDRHHDQAVSAAPRLDTVGIVMPWPVLYEAVNTRFAKHPVAMAAFNRVLRRPTTRRIDDAKYRERALDAAFDDTDGRARAISLVDHVIRGILEDRRHVRVEELWTYNAGDFADVCKRYAIELICPGLAPGA